MTKALTAEQWEDIVPPFTYLKSSQVRESDQIAKEIFLKSLESRVTGWWYQCGDTFVFEHTEDAIMMKLLVGQMGDVEKDIKAVL